MTLQELFAQINANYNTVKSLADSIYKPSAATINNFYTTVTDLKNELYYGVQFYYGEFMSDIWLDTLNVVRLLEDFIDEFFYSTGSIKGNLQSIFNTYMARVVTDVQNSVELVQTEMYNEVDFLSVNVDAAIFDLQDYLDTEVNAMHAEIDLLSIDVISWIDAAVANLADTLNTRIEEVNTNLTARIDFLEIWTAQVVQAVYDYVDIQNAEMLARITDIEDTLYFYINNRVKELENYIVAVQNDLNARLTREVNTLNAEIAMLEITLVDKITALESQSLWNFTFFDLFTFNPELSLLRVLLRSDEDFKRYKPYWQALFAKVLAED